MALPGGDPGGLADLAERTGVRPDRLAHWQALGLLPGGDADEPDTVARVRLLRFATRRGVTAEAIAAVSETQGDVLARYLGYLGVPAERGVTVQEAARLVGLDEDLARRLLVANGIGDQDELFPDDVASLRGVATALAAGLPAEALVQMARVFGDALGRVADAESRLFHFYVHERLRAEGLEGSDLAAASKAVGDSLLALVEPAILHVHRRAWERALREDMLVHLAEDVAPADGSVGRLQVAVVFIDLAGFTPLTEAMGDAAAAGVLDRFSDLVREAANRCDGRVVKQIGDEFMLVFPSAEAAVRCGTEITARAAAEPQFPSLRIGAHAGPALYREADYLGGTVNTAARVASVAERGRFLATAAVRASVDDRAVQWRSTGEHRLKGMAEPVELFELVRPDAAPERARDPVCGMELDEEHCDISLTWHGREVHFCSEACRERFAAAPELYGDPGTRHAADYDPLS